jgi:4-aminobutyrate aminotransferase
MPATRWHCRGPCRAGRDRGRKLCARANELGSRLKQKLEAIRATTPEIIDIRGPGFMVAVEFANPARPRSPTPAFTTRVRLEAQKRGLILLTCGVYGNVVRFLAPITIPEAHFAEAHGILEASVAAARKGWPRFPHPRNVT